VEDVIGPEDQLPVTGVAGEGRHNSAAVPRSRWANS
jgi:hypothetical protein